MDIMGDNRGYAGSSGIVSGGPAIYCGTSGNGWLYETSPTFADPTSDGSLGILPEFDADFGTTVASDVTWSITQITGSSRSPTITARGSTIAEGYDFNITPSTEGDYTGCEFVASASIGATPACSSLTFYCDRAWSYLTPDFVAVDPASSGNVQFGGTLGDDFSDLLALDSTIADPGNAGNVTWSITQLEGTARTATISPITGNLSDGFQIVFDASTYGGFAMTAFSAQASVSGTPVRGPIAFHCVPYYLAGWSTTGTGPYLLTPDAGNDFAGLTTGDFVWTITPAGSGETINTPVPVSGSISAGFTVTKTGPNPTDIVNYNASVIGRDPGNYALTPALSV